MLLILLFRKVLILKCIFFSELHSYLWNDTLAVYHCHHVVQRSPALQPCHSLPALSANTIGARVTGRHRLLGRIISASHTASADQQKIRVSTSGVEFLK